MRFLKWSSLLMASLLLTTVAVARDYSASGGRYLQPDPVGTGGGLNRFVYSEGNPLSLIDPEGLTPKPGRLTENMPLGPGTGGAVPLPRWNPRPGEFKPAHSPNPAHDPRSPLYNPKKTPEPEDCAAVYKRSVPDDATDARHWWGKSDNGLYYRFHNANDGTMHFSGSFTPFDPAVPKYVRDRLGK